jgi:hypothetical protein
MSALSCDLSTSSETRRNNLLALQNTKPLHVKSLEAEEGVLDLAHYINFFGPE